MGDTLEIFGYGSLLFSPELPDAICGRQPARLLGYRRAFNKRSISRSCAINATPRRPRSDDRRSESRGLYYLEGVREQLRAIGIIDADLEALAAALRAESGPWVDLVAPPQASTP